MKLPRDISGRTLCKRLEKIGYQIVWQTGSHIRLTKQSERIDHNITVPDHADLKVGTLNSILLDIAQHHRISKDELMQQLFSK